jgi:tryptophan synthase alpha chain
MHLNNPVLVGFGVKDKATFTSACKYANGAIVGSAYINVVSNAPNIEEATSKFVQNIRGCK